MPTTHLAISGFNLRTPSDRITKSAGSKTCALVSSRSSLSGKFAVLPNQLALAMAVPVASPHTLPAAYAGLGNPRPFIPVPPKRSIEFRFQEFVLIGRCGPFTWRVRWGQRR